MRARVISFKIGTSKGTSFQMTQKGIIDVRERSMDGYSKKIIRPKENAKQLAIEALDWLFASQKKQPSANLTKVT